MREKNDTEPGPPTTDGGAGGPGTGAASGSGGERGDGGGSSGGAGGVSSGGTSPAGGADAGPDTGLPDGSPPGPHLVDGTLRVSDLLFVDGDMLDPTRAVEINDTRDDAQLLTSPGMVSGFVGVVPSFVDPEDYFRVDLADGDAATLYIGRPSDGSALPDLDLRLLDSAGAVVEESLGTSSVEQVQAPTAGTYYLVVLAYDAQVDRGLYTLSIGSSAGIARAGADATRDLLNPRFPMMAGEALVKLRPGASRATTASRWAALGVRPLSPGANAIGYSRVALPGAGVTAPQLPASLADARATILSIKQLRRSPDVLWVEPNYVRQKMAPAPDDPLFASQWHYGQIALTSAWDHSRGAGTVVAVLDTGVKRAHPDFVNADSSSQLLAGYDMISIPSIAADGNGRDSNSDDPGDGQGASESSWHGTHVAGTIAAATDNALGCAGVAPLAKILPLRVLGVGGGTDDDIVQAILYSARLTNDAGVLPASRADVINMSLGGPGRSSATADAIALARAAGTIVIASAGNDSRDAGAYSPAAEPGVVTVGAVDYAKRLAWYSNFGSVIDLVAPGGDESVDATGDGIADGVLSLVYANNGTKLYTPYEGTSMAAPHVAGMVALMRAVHPALSPEDFDAMIAGTSSAGRVTTDLGPTGKDTSFGHGLINANLAVLTALAAASTPAVETPTLLVSPASLQFASGVDDLTLEISNAGRGTLTVSSVTTDQPWLTVAPRSVGVNTVTVDRTGLSDGIYSASVTVQSNGGSATVPVRLSVTSVVPRAGDVGPVYVLAVDVTTRETVAQYRAVADDGYAFELTLDTGDYELLAGTDMDNNGYLGDEGEAYGAFPLTSAPKVLQVEGDERGLEFPVRYEFALGRASTARQAR